ncbi:unnamed protein product [Macrosiphum euphorbiae]|uniref:Uncharacterized protein n=1 Tax=Macrosiphum euphorbiae TaxID=13131 RepID=A0AAV0WRZ1_9HEMI|nr:unnamed protein product [Macrosiphum euphorbiae]
MRFIAVNLVMKMVDQIFSANSGLYHLLNSLRHTVSQPTFTEHNAPVRNAKRRLLQSPASPPFDVNDGSDFFNPIGTSTPYFNPTYTSTPCKPTFAEHPAPVRNVKRRLF